MENRKTALIVGMARSGISSAKLLYKNGYKVLINDIKREIPGIFEALKGIEYTNYLGAPVEALLEGVDLIVVSPVIPLTKPFVAMARARGIEVIGEIELGYRFADRGSKFVCIGGTNGKTTTTTLTGEIFKAAGETTYVLGNIGIPITEHSMDIKAGDVVVAETAALQLESIDAFRANAAALLNITEDHLNRFNNSMEQYIAAKARMFENQTEDDYAILNLDDPIVSKMAEKTRAKVLWVSQKQEVQEGVFNSDGILYWRHNEETQVIINAKELQIPGAHNIENAMCASALALCMGVPMGIIRQVLRSFMGVEHRIEFVREKNGIRYINDSKATNPDSTIKAIEAMDRPTILLLGVGEYDKYSDFVPLFNSFGGKIKAVIASGVTIPEILAGAEITGFKEFYVSRGTFTEMVEQATALAKPGYNVLLSPAAASWGMFADYEERGRIFKEIVKKL